MTDHTIDDPRTGGERYFAKLNEDPEYRAGYLAARARIDAEQRSISAYWQWKKERAAELGIWRNDSAVEAAALWRAQTVEQREALADRAALSL